MKEALKTTQPVFETTLNKETEGILESLSEEFATKLSQNSFEKEECAEMKEFVLKKAREVERMAKALEDYPGLSGFTREGLFMQNKKRKDLISIYVPKGEDFIKNILEEPLPSGVSRHPPTWELAKLKRKNELDYFKKKVELIFNMSHDVFCKILKRQSIPAIRLPEGKDWESCEEFLEI